MTKNDRRAVITLAEAMDYDTLSLWLSIGKGLSHAEGKSTRPALSLVPRPLLHALQNRIRGDLEGLAPELVRDTVGR